MYVIYIFAPGADPDSDNPTEVDGPFPRSESAAFTYRQLEEQQQKLPAHLREHYRIIEIPVSADAPPRHRWPFRG